MLTAKEELNGLKRSSEYIGLLEEEIEELEAISEIGGIDFQERVQTTKQNTKDELYCKVIELKSRLEKEKLNRVKKRIEIQEKLENLEAIYSEVLTRKYIYNYTWFQIAMDMGYSEQHTYRLHAIALDKYQKEIEKKKN